MQCRPYLHPEVLALKQHDASLNRALARSKRVGDALLKAEEEESATIKQLGNELLSKNRQVAGHGRVVFHGGAITACWVHCIMLLTLPFRLDHHEALPAA